MQRTKSPKDKPKLKTSEKQESPRRYQEGKFPVYDEVFSRKLKRALNSGTRFSGIGNSQRRIIELTGNEEGYYKENGSWRKALIPSSREELKKVWGKFKRWQAEQIRLGRAIKPPKEWPDDLLQQRLKAEALVDIYHWEKAKAERIIQKLEAERQKSRQNQVLPHGPQGRIAFNRGETKIVEADGQSVSYSPSGIPYIAEPESPYDGMPILSYRQMCKDWKKEKGLTLDQLREYRNKIFKQERKQALLAEEPLPETRLPVTNSKVPFWMKRLGITKDDWPEWPDGAESITDLENELESTVENPE